LPAEPSALLRRYARPAVRAFTGGRRDPSRVFGELVWNRLDELPDLRADVEAMSDEEARRHFGEEEPIESEHHRRVLRLFHAWRVVVLRARIGARLPDATLLDVGDTDGLILRHLGKGGTGFNLSEAALRNIRGNGVDAVGGDGHGLPFDDAVFDYVLCFETLEHVESPHQVLSELARVCKPEGRLFVSIPWVPTTVFHPRDPTIPRGYQHVCELARDDFHALVSHSPVRVTWEDICWVLGRPRTFEQRLFLAANRGRVTPADSFRGFQFYELAHLEA
jgi:SAM-dependent methyltransferase